MHYYAIEYTYGNGMVDEHGDTVATIHRFPTFEDAEAFVAASPTPLVGNPGYRVLVTTNHQRVREAVRAGQWAPAEAGRGEAAI